MQRFVIVVDTQADFMCLDGALPVGGADALITPMQAWIASLDPADVAGVLFTFDTHLAEEYRGSAEAALFPIHCVAGTPGWANVLDAGVIDPAIPAYRLRKGVFDMWAEPHLVVEAVRGCETLARDTFFATLKTRGVSEVTVIGVAADYCVRWAIQGLVRSGFTVDVLARLTRGIDRPIERVVAEDFAGQPVRLEAAP